MKTVNVRRISQVFFLCLFTWFCIVSTLGESFSRIAGWPVNWFLQLDPLTAVATALTTHTIYWPLLWGVLLLVLTVILGRFFCGWICPFGTIHHFIGWLGKRGKSINQKVELNRFRRLQMIKYYILAVFLILAFFPLKSGSLQTGLLDPIALVTRSFNLALLPVVDRSVDIISGSPLFYEGAVWIFAVFFTAILLNLFIPRFYCRFICPLGALLAITSRFAVWRIGKNKKECLQCEVCEKNCEGGCEPSGRIKISECVLCFNCLDDCRHNTISYSLKRSAAGEITNPAVSRRGFAWSLGGALLGLGALRLSGTTGNNWFYRTVRPPGSLPENEFLKRCIKCGQCMRVCPTNVLQPAGLQSGLEGLGTPVLNNRIGTSGCQQNCVACGQTCPTAAIRPISVEEKMGVGEYKDQGPIKLGTAFIDKGRCLPWAMATACLVCEENCPVSPKAIYTRASYITVRNGNLRVKGKEQGTLNLQDSQLQPHSYSSGDYYIKTPGGKRYEVVDNTEDTVTLNGKEQLGSISADSTVQLQLRLDKPYIDPEKCIGCGVCEHVCPVSGRRAIRVSAEGESRSRERQLTP